MSVCEMSVMDLNGDTKTIWDKNNPDEVKVARKTFNELKKKGYHAYKVDKDGNKGSIMSSFDPDAEKVILSPAMAGG